MIRPGKIAEFENVRTAIECRYMFEAILDNELLKATQRQIKASLFEFVSDNRAQDKERYITFSSAIHKNVTFFEQFYCYFLFKKNKLAIERN